MGLNHARGPDEIDDKQLDLLAEGALGDGYDLGGAGELEKSGVFTGERFRRLKPMSFQRVLELSAQGVGQIRIAKMVGCSVHTVAAVQVSCVEQIAIEKTRLGRKFQVVAGLATEGMIEDLSDPVKRSKMSTKDKAIVASIATEKGELLTGGATHRAEVKTGPSIAELQAFVTGLGGGNRAANRGVDGALVVEAEVVESPPSEVAKTEGNG